MKSTAPRSTLRKIIKKHKPQLRLAANADLLEGNLTSRELVVVAILKKNTYKRYSWKELSRLNLLDCDILLFTNVCGSQGIKALALICCILCMGPDLNGSFEFLIVSPSASRRSQDKCF
ncbi:centromere protein W isoform X1 [Agelaius phoeniceus]|uniref:centromere protein W isoform X1 n=1 Tax=Agelaius phoeniceus TaxID=39638 RepID=UPI004054EBB3